MIKKLLLLVVVPGVVLTLSFFGLLLLILAPAAAIELYCGGTDVYLPPSEVTIDWEALEADLDELSPQLRDVGATELTEEQREGILVITGVASSWLANEIDLHTAYITAAEESRFKYTLTQEESHADSVGMFQQQPSSGWGTVEQISDPVYATNAFFTGVTENGKKGLFDFPERFDLEIWEAAQLVQASGKGADSNGLVNYGPWVDVGQAILDAVDLSTYGDPDEETQFGSLGCFISDDAGGSSSDLAVEMQLLGLSNGELPAEWLMTVSPGCEVTIYADAAQHWISLMDKAVLDATDVVGLYCYRPLWLQQQLWDDRQCYIPGNCDGNPYPPTAFPGTSNHGWGLAIDVGTTATASVLTCSSPALVWMQVKAPTEGWKWPTWAHCGNSSEEAWHWEFEGVFALVDIPPTLPPPDQN